MNQLKSLKIVETEWDESGNEYITTILYTAPGQLHLQTSSGSESIALGSEQWSRGPQQSQWITINRVAPLVFPDFEYYSRQALEVRLGAANVLEGQPVRTVTFAVFNSVGRFDFNLYADPVTLYFRRLTMEGPGHQMVVDFVDYNPVVTITRPPDSLIATTPAP